MSKEAKIILFSCFYMIGILTFFSDFILPLSIIIFACLIVFMYREKLSPVFTIILCLIFLIGVINTNANIKYYDDLSAYTNNDVTLTANVLTIPSNSDKNKTKFYAKVSEIQVDNVKHNLDDAKTIVTINDNEQNYKNIKIGDTLQLTGRLTSPEQAKNPSQFDYEKYLQYKNTFSALYVNCPRKYCDKPSEVRCEQNFGVVTLKGDQQVGLRGARRAGCDTRLNEEWKILNHSSNFSGKLLRKLNDKRNYILSIHAKNIKSPMIEILGGIIFGDDAVAPDNDTKKSFINSGIFHILAASGMNVTLIFGIWFFCARNLRINYRLSIITGILLILFYTCMTGFGPPIIRASLMLTLILTGKLIDRKTPTMALLFLVAFLMLLYSPLMIFDVGFQLSFIVTFALILTAPLLVFNFKHKVFNYLFGSCLIPIIAQFFAAPLQMYYFNTFTMYSVFANIAIIPVLSIVSFIGFISSIIAIIPIFANKVCFIADLILNPMLIYIVKTANFFSTLPNAIIYLKKPTIIQILLYFSIIISAVILIRLKLKARRYSISLIILIALLCITFIPIKNNNPEIIFFSVGNADASLIKSSDNKYFIIDSGKLPYKSASSQAKNIIIKYLTDNGIKDIEAYIMTHFDADHAGGTIDLLDNLKIKNIYITGEYEDTNLANDIFQYFKLKNISPVVVSKEEKIYENGKFSITLTKAKGEKINNENQKSIITSIKYADKNLLYMADGDVETYNALPLNIKNDISILKLGHHGAKNTINEEMIKNTQLIIISTGKNVYNHPNEETIKIINDSQKPLLRTDYTNAIKAVLKKDKIIIYAYSPKLKRFVRL